MYEINVEIIWKKDMNNSYYIFHRSINPNNFGLGSLRHFSSHINFHGFMSMEQDLAKAAYKSAVGRCTGNVLSSAQQVFDPEKIKHLSSVPMKDHAKLWVCDSIVFYIR